jgi:hypothetical protein
MGIMTRHRKPGEKRPAHPPKHKKEMHIRQLEHGHHVMAIHEDGTPTEYAAPNTEDLHDLVEQHFAPPAQGAAPEGHEAEAEPAAAEEEE